MSSVPPVYDVIIIGGGPAGSAAGRLLASWGHRTLVIARPGDRARGLAESIPPSARKLLSTLSVLEVIEDAAFSPNRGNVVWWGTADGRLEGFGETTSDAGIQVFRPHFDELLLRQAADAGAAVRLASVRAVHFQEDSLATVECHSTNEAHRLTARFVVDCSGRAGVIARRGLRVYEPGHCTQAFLGLWRGGNWPAGGDDRTWVETYNDGWAWSLAISPTMQQVGVMVDGTATRRTRGPTMAHTYLAEVGNTHHLRAATAGAVLDHSWACDASLYSARTFTGPQFLLAGDAGCTIDPPSASRRRSPLAGSRRWRCTRRSWTHVGARSRSPSSLHANARSTSPTSPAPATTRSARWNSISTSSGPRVPRARLPRNRNQMQRVSVAGACARRTRRSGPARPLICGGRATCGS
jgi:flavin-dependent dehydrogenase